MSTTKRPTLFTIGQTAEICGVSARALRFYEKNGLIRPDKVDEVNRYRYYSYDTMRQIQTIRYLTDEGFTLSQIRQMRRADDLSHMKELFLSQISETESQISYHQRRLASLQTWCSLLTEGSAVLEHQDVSVKTRFLPSQAYYRFEHEPASEEEYQEACVETRYFTESKQQGHSMVDMGGAFIFYFPSFSQRLDGSVRRICLLQETYPGSSSQENTALFGECKWTNEKVDLGVLDTLIERSNLFAYQKKHFFLFSKSGFTKGCVEKAKQLGHATLKTYTDMIHDKGD